MRGREGTKGDRAKQSSNWMDADAGLGGGRRGGGQQTHKCPFGRATQQQQPGLTPSCGRSVGQIALFGSWRWRRARVANRFRRGKNVVFWPWTIADRWTVRREKARKRMKETRQWRRSAKNELGLRNQPPFLQLPPSLTPPAVRAALRPRFNVNENIKLQRGQIGRHRVSEGNALTLNGRYTHLRTHASHNICRLSFGMAHLSIPFG